MQLAYLEIWLDTIDAFASLRFEEDEHNRRISKGEGETLKMLLCDVFKEFENTNLEIESIFPDVDGVSLCFSGTDQETIEFSVTVHTEKKQALLCAGTDAYVLDTDKTLKIPFPTVRSSNFRTLLYVLLESCLNDVHTEIHKSTVSNMIYDLAQSFRKLGEDLADGWTEGSFKASVEAATEYLSYYDDDEAGDTEDVIPPVEETQSHLMTPRQPRSYTWAVIRGKPQTIRGP